MPAVVLVEQFTNISGWVWAKILVNCPYMEHVTSLNKEKTWYDFRICTSITGSLVNGTIMSPIEIYFEILWFVQTYQVCWSRHSRAISKDLPQVHLLGDHKIKRALMTRLRVRDQQSWYRGIFAAPKNMKPMMAQSVPSLWWQSSGFLWPWVVFSEEKWLKKHKISQI